MKVSYLLVDKLKSNSECSGTNWTSQRHFLWTRDDIIVLDHRLLHCRQVGKRVCQITGQVELTFLPDLVCTSLVLTSQINNQFVNLDRFDKHNDHVKLLYPHCKLEKMLKVIVLTFACTGC